MSDHVIIQQSVIGKFEPPPDAFRRGFSLFQRTSDEESQSHYNRIWDNRRVNVLAICNKAGAKFDEGEDAIWTNEPREGEGYSEYPAFSQKVIGFRGDLSCLDFDKHPTFGFECPHCIHTKYAHQRHAEEIENERKRKQNQSKGERKLRKVLEELYNEKFPNVRPEWLINPETNHLLELDCYNKEMGIAFEYQGRQHYEPVEFFGGEETYKKVKKRDKIKRKVCKRHSVRLIEIDSREFPHNVKKEVLKEFIESEMTKE